MSRLNLAVRIERLEQRRKRRQVTQRGLPGWLEPALIDGGLGGVGLDRSDWNYDPLPAQLTFHGDLTRRFKGYSGPIGSGNRMRLRMKPCSSASSIRGLWV
jgi:hypothetical protein